MRVWTGVNDGDPWRIEVESDCMAEGEDFTVSVWVSEHDWTCDSKASVEGAFLSSEQAREVASALLAAADEVDESNARVARWQGRQA
jgi:hypothetical protein